MIEEIWDSFTIAYTMHPHQDHHKAQICIVKIICLYSLKLLSFLKKNSFFSYFKYFLLYFQQQYLNFVLILKHFCQNYHAQIWNCAILTKKARQCQQLAKLKFETRWKRILGRFYMGVDPSYKLCAMYRRNIACTKTPALFLAYGDDHIWYARALFLGRFSQRLI